MDAPVFKKLNDIENQGENPFQTKIGQKVVSVQENFEARLFREGRPLNAYAQGSSFNANVLTFFAPVYASPGCEFYPLTIVASCDVDANICVAYTTKILDFGQTQNGIMYDQVFCKAGTPFVLKLSGEIKVLETGIVQIGVYAATSGKAYCSVRGIEVVSNA